MPRVTTQIPHRRKRPMRSSPVTGPDRFPLLEKTFGGKARKGISRSRSGRLAARNAGFLPSSLRIAVDRAFVFVIAAEFRRTRWYYSMENGRLQGRGRERNPIFSRSTPSLKTKTPISSFSGQNGGIEPNLAQDLTAPVVRPLMICFCASR